MLPIRSLLLAASIITPVFVAPAFAVTMKVTYTGTIVESFDQNDLFESGNTSLDGVAFVMEFIFDAAKAGFQYASNDMSIAYGGPGEYGTSNPVLSSSFTVNGHTETVDGDFSGRVNAFDNGNQSSVHQDNKDYSFDATGYENRYLEMNVLNLGSLFSANLEDVIPLTLFGPGVMGSGSFYFGSCTYDLQGNCSDDYHYAYGGLTFGSVQISMLDDVTAVPLPATLPMLGLGLAGLIFAQRCRTQPATKRAM